jgi:two-component system, OmpR family, phosphate regulon response regulator PhoB
MMSTSSANQPFHVLLVEDTPDLAEITIKALEHFGFSVDHAENGEQAIGLVDRRQPDVILLDLNLGGMNGWQVLEHVKQRYGQYEIPVIVTTAYSDKTNRIIGKLQYVRHYLVKPFTPSELYQVIRDVLELHKVGV